MNSEQLIALTKELIYEATHFNVPYVKEVYADKLLIVKVDENSVVDTMNKEELVSFVQGNRDSNVAPLSTKTEFHYALVDGNLGMVMITRDLELGGKRKFFTLIWEYLDERWQVVKESSVERN